MSLQSARSRSPEAYLPALDESDIQILKTYVRVLGSRVLSIVAPHDASRVRLTQ